MASTSALTLLDIPWLRQSSRKDGAVAMPSSIEKRLLAGGFVERDARRDCLTITKRGQIALTRLG